MGTEVDSDVKDLTQSYNETSLLDMPDDVLLYILQCCTARDLKALGYCCTRLCRLVQDKSLWRRVDARADKCSRARLKWYIDNVLRADTQALLLHGYAKDMDGCLGFLNVLREEGERAKCSESNWDRVEHFALQLSSNRNTELQTKIFTPKSSGLPRWGDNEVGRRGPQPCIGPQFSLTPGLFKELAVTCPALTTLALEYCNIDCRNTNLDHFPKSIKNLSLRGSKCYNMVMDKTFLFRINTYLPDLESLDVSECEWMDPATLLPLSKLASLAELRMCDCSKLTEFVAYASLTARYGFRALKSLDLRGSPVGDSEISALGWLPSLERLWLAHTHGDMQEDTPTHVHAHYIDDTAVKHQQLHPWEEQEPPHLYGERPDNTPYTFDDISMELNEKEREGIKRKPDEEEDRELTGFRKRQKLKGENDNCELQSDVCQGNRVFNMKLVLKTENQNDVNVNASTSNASITDNHKSNDTNVNKNDDANTNNAKENDTKMKDIRKMDVNRDESLNKDQNPMRTDVEVENKLTVKINIDLNKGNNLQDNDSSNTEKDTSRENGENSKSSKYSAESENPPVECEERSQSNISQNRDNSTENENGEIANKSKDENGENCLKDENGENCLKDENGENKPPDNLDDCTKTDGPQPQPQQPSGSHVRFRRHQIPVVVNLQNYEINDGASTSRDGPRIEDSVSRLTERINNENKKAVEAANRADEDMNEAVDYQIEPRHHVLYVNVGPQVNTYRFPREFEASYVPGLRSLNFQRRHVDPSSLVTDFAIRRFGRADGEDVNIIHIGPNGPSIVVRQETGSRPDRSNLRFLSVNGYRNITNRSLVHLATAAPLLSHIDFNETNVTDAGAETFRSIRPDCTLVYSKFTDKK